MRDKILKNFRKQALCILLQLVVRVLYRYPAPTVMSGLRDVNVNEGERAHFEAKVGPVGDPSMVVEWYFNGSIITASKFLVLLYKNAKKIKIHDSAQISLNLI